MKFFVIDSLLAGVGPMEWIKQLATSPDWKDAFLWLRALLAFQAVDIVMGLTASFKLKRLSSTVGWNGFTKKAATLLIVCMAGIIDPLFPFNTTVGAIAFYTGWEGLSIIEKAGFIGIPVPKKLLETLAKLREETNATPVKIIASSVPIKVEQSQPVEVTQNTDSPALRVDQEAHPIEVIAVNSENQPVPIIAQEKEKT